MEDRKDTDEVPPLFPLSTETDKTEKSDTLKDYKRLWTNLLFIRFLFMMFLSLMGAFGTIYILPALARERGADDITSAFTVTLVGATELIRRKV